MLVKKANRLTVNICSAWAWAIVCSFLLVSISPKPLLAVSPANDLFASVNGEEIPMSVFNTSYRLQLAGKKFFHSDQSGEILQRLKMNAATFTINRILLIQEAKRLNILPSSDEIEENALKDINRFGGKARMTQFLKDNEIEIQDYRSMVRDIYISTFFIENHIGTQLSISEEESRTYYQAQRETYDPPARAAISDFIFQIREGGDGSMGLEYLKKMADSNDYQSIKMEAHRTNMSNSDVTFLKQTKNIFLNEDKSPLYWPHVAGMEPGNGSFFTEADTIHVIFLHRRTYPEKLPFEDARAEITNVLEKEQYKKHLESKLGELREKAQIEIFLK